MVSALLLLVLRAKTPEQWVELGERKPRTQGAIRLLRAIGLDPAKALLAIQQILTARDPTRELPARETVAPPAPPTAPAEQRDPSIPPAPPSEGEERPQ